MFIRLVGARRSGKTASMRAPKMAQNMFGWSAACMAVLAMALAPTLAEAKVKKRVRGHTHVESMRHQDVSAALIIDADSGKVLYAENASEARYPASLTKMMTLYLTFEALKSGKLKLMQDLPVSAHAASMPQTNLALHAGASLPVETAIRALVVRSANDAAVVLGEALGGTEPGFGVKMTEKAHQLGMVNTTFKNASGLPNKDQKTTDSADSRHVQRRPGAQDDAD